MDHVTPTRIADVIRMDSEDAFAARDEDDAELAELERISLRLDGFEMYAFLASLIAGFSFQSLDNCQDSWENLHAQWPRIGRLVPLAFTATLVGSIFSGLYATIIFALCSLYSKTALAEKKDERMRAFLTRTVKLRTRAFHHFLYCLACFAANVLLLAMVRLEWQQSMPTLLFGSLFLYRGLSDMDQLLRDAAPIFDPKTALTVVKAAVAFKQLSPSAAPKRVASRIPLPANPAAADDGSSGHAAAPTHTSMPPASRRDQGTGTVSTQEAETNTSRPPSPSELPAPGTANGLETPPRSASPVATRKVDLSPRPSPASVTSLSPPAAATAASPLKKSPIRSNKSAELRYSLSRGTSALPPRSDRDVFGQAPSAAPPIVHLDLSPTKTLQQTVQRLAQRRPSAARRARDVA